MIVPNPGDLEISKLWALFPGDVCNMQEKSSQKQSLLIVPLKVIFQTPLTNIADKVHFNAD